MKLLVVESPSKAKTINQYLGKDFVVISSYGHLRGLPSEDGAVLPDENFKMRFEILPKSKKQVDEIVKRYKACDELMLATDPDREGEAISWHILEALRDRGVLRPNVPVRRVVFNEITKQAVLNAVANPRDINQDLVESQQTRQALDYLVGFTLSPVLWRKLPGSRSAGRVQSVALRIICDREEEIEKFKSEEYWTVDGSFDVGSSDVVPSTLIRLNGKKLEKFSLNNEKDTQAAVSKLKGLDYKVLSLESREVNRQPHPPFTTSTLLQEAARRMGFSAKKTSKLAQDLYEGISIGGKTTGLITYMRTDSVSVSELALNASRDFIGSEYGKPYLPAKPRFFKNKSKNAQEAHEAIRPTDMSITPEKAKSSLDNDHYRLYDLIWRRMIASQMNNAILDSVTLDISDKSEENVFRATGSTIKFDGFLKLYGGKSVSSDENIIPKVTKDQLAKLAEITPEQHFTEPPGRYSEAALVKKLEELGIGRPSTYPSIISILQERGYVVLDKKRFIAVPKGRVVSAFLTSFFEKYVEYDFTAKLEDELDDISNGDATSKKVLQGFWTPFKTRIDEVLQVKGSEILEKMEARLSSYLYKDKDHECSVCKKGTMRLKNGKFGPFLGCSNYPECKNIERIPDVLQGAADASQAEEQTQGMQLPHALGEGASGYTMSIKKGPYGIYLEGIKGKEVKRAKIPAGRNLQTVDLEYADSLMKMPRELGSSEEYGVIKAGFGRFGPYVEYGGKYVSIKGKDPVTISLEEAVELIASKPQTPARGGFKKAAATKTAAKTATKKAPTKAKRTTKKK